MATQSEHDIDRADPTQSGEVFNGAQGSLNLLRQSHVLTVRHFVHRIVR